MVGFRIAQKRPAIFLGGWHCKGIRRFPPLDVHIRPFPEVIESASLSILPGLRGGAEPPKEVGETL